jgi:hypothetical protein
MTELDQRVQVRLLERAGEVRIVGAQVREDYRLLAGPQRRQCASAVTRADGAPLERAEAQVAATSTGLCQLSA